MNSDLVDVFLLSFVSILNPTLLAAVTLMLFLENPRRVMLGYLLGAYTTSITLGLLIAFSLQGSSFVSTSRSTLSPAEDIVVGLLLLLVAFVLATDRDEPLRRRRRDRKGKGGEEKEAWPQRLLGRGSPGSPTSSAYCSRSRASPILSPSTTSTPSTRAPRAPSRWFSSSAFVSSC